MNIFFDMEFTGLHKNTTPISLGMVTEKGDMFYAEFIDYDKKYVENDAWLRRNVIDNLLLGNNFDYSFIKEYINNSVIIKGNRKDIKKCLTEWLENVYDNDKITFVSDCYAYDWLLLNHVLWGNGMNINSKMFNYIPIDLSTMFYMKNIDPDICREKYCGVTLSKHNALDDAIIIKYCHDKLTDSRLSNIDQITKTRYLISECIFTDK